MCIISSHFRFYLFFFRKHIKCKHTKNNHLYFRRNLGQGKEQANLNQKYINVRRINYQYATNPPKQKEDNFYAADYGETSEESHGASNETQLGLRLDLLVSLDVVEGGRVKVDLHQLKG